VFGINLVVPVTLDDLGCSLSCFLALSVKRSNRIIINLPFIDKQYCLQIDYSRALLEVGKILISWVLEITSPGSNPVCESILLGFIEAGKYESTISLL
jgi:hypothetical protein